MIIWSCLPKKKMLLRSLVVFCNKFNHCLSFPFIFLFRLFEWDWPRILDPSGFRTRNNQEFSTYLNKCINNPCKAYFGVPPMKHPGWESLFQTYPLFIDKTKFKLVILKKKITEVELPDWTTTYSVPLMQTPMITIFKYEKRALTSFIYMTDWTRLRNSLASKFSETRLQ